MLHEEEAVTVHLFVVNGVPSTDMTGNCQTGGVHIHLKIFLFHGFLLVLFLTDHGDRHDFIPQLRKHLRLFEELRILECKIAGERTKTVFRQPHNHKCPGNNVIDVSVFIPKGAVEGQTFELGFLVADNGNRVIKGVNGFDTTAHHTLQRLEIGADIGNARSFFRFNHHNGYSAVLLLRLSRAADPVFVRNVIQRTVELSAPAITGASDITGIGKAPLLIHCNVSSIAFIVDVVCQRSEILFGVNTNFVSVVIAKIGLVTDTGHNIIAIQIESQIDEVINVADFIASGFHNGNELFLIAQGKLVNQGGKVVELIKAFVLAKHFLNAIDRAFIVGDKPFLIGLTEIVLRTDPDAFKNLLHFFLGGGELHPFTDQLTLVIFSEIGDKGFKISIQYGHRHPPFSHPSCCPA